MPAERFFRVPIHEVTSERLHAMAYITGQLGRDNKVAKQLIESYLAENPDSADSFIKSENDPVKILSIRLRGDTLRVLDAGASANGVSAEEFAARALEATVEKIAGQVPAIDKLCALRAEHRAEGQH
jgi:hypothetical protein